MEITELDLREKILETINKKPGINETKLSLVILEIFWPYSFSSEYYDNALRQLEEQKEIVRVEFVLPFHTDIRVKYFYFPSKTIINIHG